MATDRGHRGQAPNESRSPDFWYQNVGSIEVGRWEQRRDNNVERKKVQWERQYSRSFVLVLKAHSPLEHMLIPSSYRTTHPVLHGPFWPSHSYIVAPLALRPRSGFIFLITSLWCYRAIFLITNLLHLGSWFVMVVGTDTEVLKSQLIYAHNATTPFPVCRNR